MVVNDKKYKKKFSQKNKRKTNKRKTTKGIKESNKLYMKGGGAIEWPKELISECANLKNEKNVDECFRALKVAADNPFFLSDNINGYTNNGFYNGWGLKIPNNVEYIEVYNSDDISKAVKYGLKKNKKIIVKNTGHDYIGRSYPEDGMLVIFTHNMSNVLWVRDLFVINEKGEKVNPGSEYKFHETCPVPINYDKGYYIVDAGVQWWKVFDYMNKNKDVKNENRLDVWAMKGASNTVGAAGGWILDGGFSSFTKLFGMGIDNILSMEVILADGSIKTTSYCKEPELFFAFRGGGACNFGIVSNVTYALLPALTDFGDFFIKIEIPNEDENIFKQVFILILESNLLINKHFSGTVQIFKKGIDIFLSYANKTYDEIRAEFVFPLIEKLKTVNIVINLIENKDISNYTGDIFFGSSANAILSAQPNSNLHEKNKKFTESHNRWWEYESYNDFIVSFGSRYLLITDIENKQDCVNKFWDILETINMIQLETSKGLYGADKRLMDINASSAVNPKIREAIGLIYIRSYLKDFNPIVEQPYNELLKVIFKYENHKLIFNDWDTTIDSLKDEPYNEKTTKLKSYILEKAKESNIRTTIAIQKLRTSFGGGATYINHSDINEPNWGNTFWGEKNFKKLIELKKKYDPNDVFQHRYSIPLE
jgi:hypothetical protein